MQWRNQFLRTYMLEQKLIIKANYETALTKIRDMKPIDAKKKCACMINGVNYALCHDTVGVSPNTITVFFDFTNNEPVIWGLGAHNGSNKDYLVKWDSGKPGKVTLP
jgi:hypothetical protein